MNHPHHPDEMDHRAMEAERNEWLDRHPKRWVRPARPVSPEPPANIPAGHDMDGNLIQIPIPWLWFVAILAGFAVALVVLG